MSRPLIVAGVFSCLLAASLAGLAVESAKPPVYVSMAEVHAKLARTKDGLVSSQLPTGVGAAVVLMVRRDAPGEVEVHDGLADVLVAQEDKTSVLVRGQVQGNHQTTPGEWRGGKITAAKTYADSPRFRILPPLLRRHGPQPPLELLDDSEQLCPVLMRQQGPSPELLGADIVVVTGADCGDCIELD